MASTPTFVSVWFGVEIAVVVGTAVGKGDGVAGMVCDAQFNANAATKLTMIVLNVAMENCAELFGIEKAESFRASNIERARSPSAPCVRTRCEGRSLVFKLREDRGDSRDMAATKQRWLRFYGATRLRVTLSVLQNDCSRRLSRNALLLGQSLPAFIGHNLDKIGEGTVL